MSKYEIASAQSSGAALFVVCCRIGKRKISAKKKRTREHDLGVATRESQIRPKSKSIYIQDNNNHDDNQDDDGNTEIASA